MGLIGKKQQSQFKTIFEEKKELTRIELERKMKKTSSHIPGSSKSYTQQERKEMLGKGLEKILPKKFGSHISELDAKMALRELKKQESLAKTSAEKLKINRERRWLEQNWGLKGKY